MTIKLHDFGLDRLTVDERLELIGELWDSLFQLADQIPLTDAQRNELDRRLESYKSDPLAGESWEVVRARIEGQRK